MADRETVGVLVVSEDSLGRAGLRALLGGRSGIKIVGEALSLAELPQLIVERDPDIIVDIEYPLNLRTVDSTARMIKYVNSVTSARMIVRGPDRGHPHIGGWIYAGQ